MQVDMVRPGESERQQFSDNILAVPTIQWHIGVFAAKGNGHDQTTQ